VLFELVEARLARGAAEIEREDLSVRRRIAQLESARGLGIDIDADETIAEPCEIGRLHARIEHRRHDARFRRHCLGIRGYDRIRLDGARPGSERLGDTITLARLIEIAPGKEPCKRKYEAGRKRRHAPALHAPARTRGALFDPREPFLRQRLAHSAAIDGNDL